VKKCVWNLSKRKHVRHVIFLCKSTRTRFLSVCQAWYT